MSYPRQYNAASDFVDRNVEEGRGDKPAFIDPERSLTYAELQAGANRVANLLRASGLEPEDRVAMIMLDTVDFPTVFWGAIKAGVVPVAINTLLSTEQYRYILGDSRVKALFVSALLEPTVAPVLGDPEISQDCDLCEHHPGEGDGLTWEVFDERYPHGPDGWAIA